MNAYFVKCSTRRLGSYAIGVAVGLVVSQASAAVVINYGGDYVSANQTILSFSSSDNAFVEESTLGIDFSGDGDTTDMVVSRAVSLANPLIATSVDYTGPLFYGGLLVEDGDGTIDSGSQYLRIDNVGAADEIAIITRKSHAAIPIFFQKADFTGVNPGESVKTAADSSISLGAGRSVNGAYRFLIQNGLNFYVSETLASNTDSINPFTENFQQYDIADGTVDIPFNAELGPTYTVPGSTFTDIQAVGYVYLKNATSSSGDALDVNAFSANLTVVPEPAALGLLGLGGLALLGKRRRVR